MELWQLLTGGALVGVLAGFWGKIKALAWRLVSFLIARIELDESLDNAVLNYLAVTAKPSRTRDRSLNFTSFSQSGKWAGRLTEQLAYRATTFWYGWVPIYYKPKQEGQQNAPQVSRSGELQAGSVPADRSTSAALYYVRGTFSDLRHLTAASEQSLARFGRSGSEARRWVVTVRGEGGRSNLTTAYGRYEVTDDPRFKILWRTPPGPEVTAVSRLVLPAEAEVALHEAKTWLSRRDWYEARGLPWRRGLLLHGVPGSGKTSLAAALAYDLGMPLYAFRLAGMTEQAFVSGWQTVRENTPCVVLFEDLDAVFHGRVNVATTMNRIFPMRGEVYDDSPGDSPTSSSSRGGGYQPLSFDTLINCLDGAERSDGVFTVITTNDVNKIDPALGGKGFPRPGRIDRVIELGFMRIEDKDKLASRLLFDHPEALAAFRVSPERDKPDETAAQVQERCVQLALAELYRSESDKLTEPCVTLAFTRSA